MRVDSLEESYMEVFMTQRGVGGGGGTHKNFLCLFFDPRFTLHFDQGLSVWLLHVFIT